MRELTWLHVSDFHIKDGDPYDRNQVLKALVQHVRDERMSNRRCPDIIFATGDIADSGLSSQYEQATLFFDELLNAAGLDRSRLFVIPGNHDVDRSKGKRLQRTLANATEAKTFFGTRADIDLYLGKQDAFREWYTKYFERIRVLTPGSTCDPPFIIEVNGLQIAITSVNSALFCQDIDDEHKLWIGRRCLESATAEVKASQADIRIGLIHHPHDWLHNGEVSSIKASMNDAFDVILRGHLHETEVEQTDGNLGNCFCLASGAAYQGSQFPNRVLYAIVEFEAQTITVHPIQYLDSPRAVWTLDTSLFPNREKHEGQFKVVWKGKPSLPLAESNSGPFDLESCLKDSFFYCLERKNNPRVDSNTSMYFYGLNFDEHSLQLRTRPVVHAIGTEIRHLQEVMSGRRHNPEKPFGKPQVADEVVDMFRFLFILAQVCDVEAWEQIQ